MQAGDLPVAATQKQHKTIPAFGGPRESDDGALPSGDLSCAQQVVGVALLLAHEIVAQQKYGLYKPVPQKNCICYAWQQAWWLMKSYQVSPSQTRT